MTDRVKKSRNWPGAANKLRGHLQREVTFLRTKGIEIEFDVREKTDAKNKKIKITNTLFVPVPSPVPPGPVLPDLLPVPLGKQTNDLFEPVEEVEQGTAENAGEDAELSPGEEDDKGTYQSIFGESKND